MRRASTTIKLEHFPIYWFPIRILSRAPTNFVCVISYRKNRNSPFFSPSFTHSKPIGNSFGSTSSANFKMNTFILARRFETLAPSKSSDCHGQLVVRSKNNGLTLVQVTYQTLGLTKSLQRLAFIRLSRYRLDTVAPVFVDGT